MVSTIFQSTEGPSVREQVRWTERDYATQIGHKAAGSAGTKFGNGGLMVDGHGEWAFNGSRAVEQWQAVEALSDWKR
jgi:hypothetical protein